MPKINFFLPVSVKPRTLELAQLDCPVPEVDSPPPGVLVRTLIQVQSIPPRTPPQPVEWFGPMPPIGSEMTIVGVKHEVVKYNYDVEYDISVDQAMPKSGAATEPHYGYMRCTGTESGYQSMTPIRLSKA